MKHLRLSFGLSLAVAAFALACNTAQVTSPALIDAGPPCNELAPVATCDGGGPVLPGACSGGVTLVLNVPDASNTIKPGTYPLGCSVGFFVADPASPDCLRAPACTCVAPDSGAAADDAGTSDGGEAGVVAPVGPGTWQCFAQ